ncbi:MAG: transposase, partial [Bacteroidia bacterium]
EVLIEETFGKSQTFQKLESRISKQFANLFSSYTQSYNKVFNREGSLYNPNFKHKKVDNDAYFTKLVHYIHANPVDHGFVSSIEDWPYSSYNSFLSDKKTLLKREDVLDWFYGKEDFIKYHQQPIDPKMDFDFD